MATNVFWNSLPPHFHAEATCFATLFRFIVHTRYIPHTSNIGPFVLIGCMPGFPRKPVNIAPTFSFDI